MILYKYTDKEIKELLKTMVILCDTREQNNGHIKTELERMKITYQDYKLDVCDYSVMLPANADMGILRPLHFDKAVGIERKGSLDELAGNFTKERERLKDEFIRAGDMKVFLLIEGACYSDILHHRYKSQLNPKSFYASLLSFQERYNLNVSFMDKSESGKYIYSILYYYVRNYLLG